MPSPQPKGPIDQLLRLAGLLLLSFILLTEALRYLFCFIASYWAWLVGLGLLTCIVAYLIWRYRKKRDEW